VMDVVATVWFLSLLSGLSLAVLGRSPHSNGREDKGPECELIRTIPSRESRHSQERSEAASRQTVGR
jgi:hypothetical protein